MTDRLNRESKVPPVATEVLPSIVTSSQELPTDLDNAVASSYMKLSLKFSLTAGNSQLGR